MNNRKIVMENGNLDLFTEVKIGSEELYFKIRICKKMLPING